MGRYIVRGPFKMIVVAGNKEEARKTAERILGYEGIKAQAIEVRKVGAEK